MWNKFFFSLLLVSLIGTSLIGQESFDQENPVLIWEPIPNVTTYQLQIKNNSDEIIFELDLKETSYNLNLEPGKYSHRVGSYNKFGKISSYSEWFPFVISRSLSPEVTSDKNIIGTKKESQTVILIEGKNFYRDTKLSLKNDSDSVSITSIKLKKGVFEVIVNNENTKVGTYDLILENPRKKILVLNNYFQLKDSDSIFPTTPTATPDNPPISSGPYPYWKQAGKSMLLPGWGQINKEHYFSAVFFNLGILFSAAYYKSSSDNFYHEKHTYNQTVLRGALYQSIDGQDIGLIYNFIANENQYQRAKAAAGYTGQAGILIASFYTLNILDALLWKTDVSLTNKEATIHLYSKIQSSPIANPNYSQSTLSNNAQLEFGFKIQF